MGRQVVVEAILGNKKPVPLLFLLFFFSVQQRSQGLPILPIASNGTPRKDMHDNRGKDRSHKLAMMGLGSNF